MLLGLTTDWKQFSIPFTALTNGNVRPFNPAKVSGFEFHFSRDTVSKTNFELWIDDLSFY